MNTVQAKPRALTVRAKLLILLAILSLPVFIVSLIQLDSYKKSLRLHPDQVSGTIFSGQNLSDPSTSLLVLTLTWALVLIATIIIAVWAIGRITRPLIDLAESASQLGSGQLSERVKLYGNDEIGTLARSLNAMAEGLESKFNEAKTQSEFIKEILDSLPLGVVLLDQKLTVRRANPTFATLFDNSTEKISGLNLYQAAPGIEALSDVIESVRASRKPYVTYGLYINTFQSGNENEELKNQQYFDVTIWPLVSPGVSHSDLLLILADASVRMQAEKLASAAFAAERSRAAELESLINQLSEGVIILDKSGGYRINPAAAEMMGRSPTDLREGVQDQLTIMPFADMRDQPLSIDRCPISRALAGEKVKSEQLKIINPNGDNRVVSISATPLTDSTGQREGAVAVFRDISEDVSRHDQLLEAFEKLQEHDRLKSAFLINVSHEFRTPLNVVIGLCQLLVRDQNVPLAPLQNEVVQRMERNARSLLDLVNDLIDFSRFEAGCPAIQLEEVDVAAVVESVIAENREQAEVKNLDLNSEISLEVGMVLTDKKRFRQVVSNLVGNAIKFTPMGEVSVVLSNNGDNQFSLEVYDTGIGMNKESVLYIFEGFRKVDDGLARSHGGVGLGLAMTRKIVNALGGDIEVDTAPGKGSCFRVTLPKSSNHSITHRSGQKHLHLVEPKSLHNSA
jgi:PAS domain S-box-containing protein